MRHPKVIEYCGKRAEIVETWQAGFRVLLTENGLYIVEEKRSGRWHATSQNTNYRDAFDTVVERAGRWAN